MKFSEQWLREWVNPALTTEQLAAQMTMAGLEVGGIEPVADQFTGVVVGEILSVEPHPDAAKLKLCQVSIGAAGLLPIVCGAANVHTGLKAPLAKVGARLPGGITLKIARLRGVESHGMLCSAAELGLSAAADGLLALPEQTPVGVDLRTVLDLDDHSITVELTPNRGDCLGVAGVAREVAVLNRMTVTSPAIAPVAPTVTDTFPVVIRAPADCPRYLGRVIRGVNPAAETPLWMRERLRRSGLRSLGPGIDVTNYVLLELGQPLHAFDLRRLSTGIEVRRAEAGETLTLLDGKVVTLAPDMLVIADQAGPVALAGVMGGESSGVADDTVDLFLECAYFTPETITGRARRIGVHTDASHRYERGVDPALSAQAVERATRLIVDIMGGEPGPVVTTEHHEHIPGRAPITLRPDRIRRVLGRGFEPAEVVDMLTRLGADVRPAADGWQVTPPSFRFDLSIEVDLIEELGRIHGYDNIRATVPQAPMHMRDAHESHVSQMRVKQRLVDRGYQEVVTYAFVDPVLQRQIEPRQRALALANPISADLAVMRTGLWPGLLSAERYNLNRRQDRVRLFETGTVFRYQDDALQQTARVGGVVIGSSRPEHWDDKARAADFFDVKADVEALLELGPGLAETRFAAESHPALHPGQSAGIYVGEQAVGWLGRLHPALAKSLDIHSPAIVFELAHSAVDSHPLPAFAPLSKFPSIRRDIAVSVDENVAAAELIGAVRNAVGAVSDHLACDIRLFDVYRGHGVETGRKSIALGLILQDFSRTLDEQSIAAVETSVVAMLKATFSAELRT